MLQRAKVVFVVYAMLASAAAAGQNEADRTTVELSESQLSAKGLVLEMAALLGGSDKFSVDMLVGYDTLQADGQKIEFGERRQLILERPAHLRNVTQTSDGRQETLLFDGESITLLETPANVYARAEQPGDIDTSVRFFLAELGMRLPLAVMLISQFPDELERRLLTIEYVEETDILGEPSHHVAGRTRDVDFQAWITTGELPLPLRIVLTYRKAPGQPQFRANFANWNLDPAIDSHTFRFEPPPGTSEIPLARQVIGSPDDTDTPTSSGGEQ